MARPRNTDPNAEVKRRNIPQLTKDVRKLNSLKAKRAKVVDLDDEIAALGTRIAMQLGFAPGLVVATEDEDFDHEDEPENAA